MPSKLPGSNTESPYVFIGDEAYPLMVNLMRPFPRRSLDEKKRVHNYRHSRARFTIECAFGMMTSKFKCLASVMEVSPPIAMKVVKACCILHNFIRKREGKPYQETVLVSHAAESLTSLSPLGQRPNSNAIETRNNFADYFDGIVGAVPWQNKSSYLQL